MEPAQLLVAYHDGRWTISVKDHSLGIFEYFHSRELAIHRALLWVREHPRREAHVTEPDGTSWTLI